MKVKNFRNKKGEGARNGSKSENVLEKSILYIQELRIAL